MKIIPELDEKDFIPIKNQDGGQRGNTPHGSVCHWFTHKQNTTINQLYRTRCGKEIQFWGYTVNKECKKCFK